MSQHVDVLIAGGGIIGLTTAWYLSGEGVRVAVVDQGEPGRQASWAGAGILPPADLASAQTPIEQLRGHSMRLLPELADELRDRIGIDTGFRRCGGIELPDPDAPAAPLPSEEWHGRGAACEPLDQQTLRRREPDLAPAIDRAVWLPGLCQLRNPWHLRALLAGCQARGVEVVANWPVRRLLSEGTRTTGAEGERGTRHAGQVLLTTGAWSDPLIQQVGWAPGIRPIRGQIALLRTGHTGVRPVLLQGKRYLVPRDDGRILAGSTEEDVGFDARPTAGGIGALLAFAVRLLPALADATVETCWAGLRPGSPDGLPYLGAVPGWQGLCVGAGHFRAGLHLSAASGKVLAQLLRGEPPLLPLDAFRLDRAARAGGIPVPGPSR